jgi:RNA polymerase sigma-70 factor (ECF subfamily)
VTNDVEQFCARVSPRLVGALVLECHDQSTAEDIAQEALARAWERWNEVSKMESPDGWVFRVAFNLVSSHHHRRSIARRVAAKLDRDPVEHPEDVASRVALAEALRDLPDRQRQAIILRYYVQLSVKEAAKAMDCAEGTVKALCHQAVAGLRDRLDVSVSEGVTTEHG